MVAVQTARVLSQAVRRSEVSRRRLLANAVMPTKRAGRRKRRSWSKTDLRELKAHSRSKSPVKRIAKAMKRTPGALRQKAFSLGLSLGHRR